jgi:hypothetical protein
MTLKRIKELARLAERIDASLSLNYSGRLELRGGCEPSNREYIDLVVFDTCFQVAQDEGDKDEGWEYYSEPRARNLRGPAQFFTEDGATLTLKQAMVLASKKATSDATV